jgi:lipoate-protein ligase A
MDQKKVIGMSGRSEIKVPGGKLIRVDCAVVNGIVASIIITGDFFLHPEDGIQELEKEIMMLRAEPEILQSHVMSFFQKGYKLVGAQPEDFAKAVVEAAREARRKQV